MIWLQNEVEIFILDHEDFSQSTTKIKRERKKESKTKK